MKQVKAEFISSVDHYKKCPESKLSEYAFIGRSNVGKSSLINMLTNNSKLAHVSSKPGKTQTINHFLIDKKYHLVDLPGYGYAQTSKKLREKWGGMIVEYLLERKQLIYLFVLIDIRIPPQAIDIEFMQWCGENGVPFVILFTKADALSKNQRQSAVASYKKHLLGYWEEMPSYFITSSSERLGGSDVLKFVEDSNKEYGQ